MDCLFCKIIAGTIPSAKIYEDDDIYAFNDIAPIAPEHVLVIPKKHIEDLNDIKEEDVELMGKLQLSIAKIAKKIGVDKSGYRLISNCGRDGMQSVQHLHYHLVGGKLLGWPWGN